MSASQPSRTPESDRPGKELLLSGLRGTGAVVLAILALGAGAAIISFIVAATY